VVQQEKTATTYLTVFGLRERHVGTDIGGQHQSSGSQRDILIMTMNDKIQ
jgi:hypothetical protein